MVNVKLWEKIKIDSSVGKDSLAVLHCGDTRDFMEEVPDESISLIITSPPYNIGKVYERRTAISKYLETQKDIIGRLVNKLKSDGSFCWQVGNYVEKGEVYPLDIYYYNIFKDLGLKLRNRIIWHFGHGLHASKRLSGRYETILWFTKSDNYIFNLDDSRVPSKYPGKRHYKGDKKGKPSCNPLGKNPSDVWQKLNEEWESAFWEIPNVKANHPEKTFHPCQFPIELVERCVLALTNRGDWVLDPFVGVGSTSIASLKNERRSIGIDKEESYITEAKKRIHLFNEGSLIPRPMTKSIYKPTGKEKVSQIPVEWLNQSPAICK